MADTAARPHDLKADCPTTLLRGCHRAGRPAGHGDVLRIVAAALLFALFLAGPAALLALSKPEPSNSLAEAQAALCAASAASCGELTGSVTIPR